jgi:hypothetical protein
MLSVLGERFKKEVFLTSLGRDIVCFADEDSSEDAGLIDTNDSVLLLLLL